jgi:hypothetical protein
MYVIPLILAVLVAIIAVAWSPIFGVVIAAIGIVLFLAYVGLRPRADEVRAPKAQPAEKSPQEPSDAAIREPR